MKRAIVFACILFYAPLCLATTIHVPADQLTIQAGIDAALTGDTVLVAPGVYDEPFKFNGKGVVVTSSQGPKVTFFYSSSLPMVSLVDNEPSSAELIGFTFLSDVEGTHVEIGTNCLPLIQENIFPNLTTANAVLISSNGGHPRIVRNLFYNNSTGHACIGVASGMADIINNTFDRNYAGFYSSGLAVAKNNIITNSTAYGISGSYSDLSYNDAWKNSPDYDGDASSGIGSISQDPQYWDPTNHDFGLPLSSPCIDAGDPNHAYDDLDGTRNDIGAFPVLHGYPTAAHIGFGAEQYGHLVATLTPTVHWTYFDTANTVQVAYELEVGTDNQWTVAEEWSTGVVMTTVDSVIYSGSPLSNRAWYYLRIRLFDGVEWGDWLVERFFVYSPQTIHVPADQPTIQAGIDAAMTGDIVLAAPGSYSERIDYKGKGIIVTSSDGPEVTFLNPSSTPTVSFINGEPSSSELSGFTFRSTRGYEHIKITGGAEPLIQRNIFMNLSADHVLILCDGAHPRIVRNLFYDNVTGSSCIGVNSGAADIVNNTFDRNGGGFYSSGRTIAKNNIITNSTEYGIYGSYSELNYNDVWNNSPDYQDGAVAGDGSLSQDPLYASPADGDYNLGPLSPCVDAGDPASAYEDSNGTRNDMGAYSGAFVYPICWKINYGAMSIGHLVTTPTPEIHWTYYDTSTTQQAAFELQVGTDKDWTVAESWNPGIVTSAATEVIYAGPPLAENLTFYLRLRVYNGSRWGEWTENYFRVHFTNIIRVPADQPTIQSGIVAAMDGDTVLVAPGVYTENVAFNGKRVVLTSSDGPEVTKILAASAVSPTVSMMAGEPKGATLRGFTISGSRATGVRCLNSSPTIIDNFIAGNHGSGNQGGGIALQNTTASLVRGNRIFGNQSEFAPAISVGDDNYSGSNDTIEFNVIYDNTGYCDIRILGTTTGLQLFNNTIIASYSGIYNQSSSVAVARNNIVTSCSFVGIGGDTPVSASYNCTYLNGMDYSNAVLGAGNIHGDPQFVNCDGKDFRLAKSSPCIDAGDPDHVYDDADGSRSDMGALPTLHNYPIASSIGFGAAQQGDIVATLVPTIHWTYLDTANTIQVAYELEVGTDNDWTVSEMWSTGVVMIGEDSVTYAGIPLSDNTVYYLRLRAYNGSIWGDWTEDYFRIHVIKIIHVPADQPTIQTGINAAVDGDTVLVAPGVYTENVAFNGKRVVLTSSDGPEVTKILAASVVSPTVSMMAGEPKGATLRGFTISGSHATGVRCLNSSPAIIDNFISGNYGLDNQGGGIALQNTTASYVRGNRIVGNQNTYAPAISVGDNGYSSTNDTIEFNVIYDNNGYCDIRILGPVTGLQLLNNTIAASYAGIYNQSTSVAVARNNIVTHCSFVGVGGDMSISASYNCTYLNASDYSNAILGAGNIHADPQFVDFVGKDFQLAFGSPCIDAGDPDHAYDDADRTRNDMGALASTFDFPLAVDVNFGAAQYGVIVRALIPTVHWTYFDTANTVQVAYELEVGTNSDWTVAEMWSTGAVTSGEDSVTYAGIPLSDTTMYYLRLRLHDGASWGGWSAKRFLVHPIRVIHIPADQATIQKGIDAAVDLDTVLVAPGSYAEQINYKGKGIVVTSSGGPEVTFLNPPSTPVVSFVSGEPTEAELSRFTIRNTSGAQHVKIGSNCQPLIQRNIFADLTASDVLISSDNGHPRIVRNLFHSNSTGYACIGVSSGTADIINNTFDGNGRGFYSYGLTVAKNNIVTNSTQYGIYGSYSELNFNNVWHNHPDYEGGAASGTGSISQNPQFVDQGNQDFRLLIASPCINSGDPDSAYNDPDGSRNDMGAIPFRVNHVPSAFALVSPNNSLDTAVTTLRPTFVWTASIDPDGDDTIGYDLMIAVDSNFAFVQSVPNLSSTTYTLTTDLLWGHRYWWNVRSADLYGSVNWPTQVFRFRTMTLGDASNDEAVNIVDLVYLVNYIFSGGQPPIPPSAGDINCDGRINIADCVYLINYIFVGGPAPCATGE